MRKRNIFQIITIILALFFGVTNCRTIPNKVVQNPPPDSINNEVVPEFPSDSKLSLKSVILGKKSIEPEKGELATFFIEASAKAQIHLTICNGWGKTVRVLSATKEFYSESQEFFWDGKDEEGRIVPSGIYFYIIKLINDQGKIFLYNPYFTSHGITLRSLTVMYYPERGTIEYTIPQAAMVMIRAGLKEGGPHLITIMDWTAYEAGKYQAIWDGKDASGYLDLYNHPKLFITLFAYTLADNSIIVKSGITGTLKTSTEGIEVFSPKLPADRNIYARSYLDLPHESRFIVEFPGFENSKRQIPVLKGIVPVRISLDASDRLALENARYEIMLFVDTVFLFEDEAGFNPFTYQWDVSSLPEGEHYLTVNILCYNGNCSVVTRKIKVMKG